MRFLESNSKKIIRDLFWGGIFYFISYFINYFLSFSNFSSAIRYNF